MIYTATVTAQLSILFLSVIQKRVKVLIAFDPDNSYLFKYVLTISMQFEGSSHVPNPGCTLENSKWAERSVVLIIRRRKLRAFQVFIDFYCAIIGVSYTENPGFKPENPNERRELYYSPFDAKNLRYFKYVSTSTMRSLGFHIQKILGIHSKTQNERRELQYSPFDAGK